MAGDKPDLISVFSYKLYQPVDLIHGATEIDMGYAPEGPDTEGCLAFLTQFLLDIIGIAAMKDPTGSGIYSHTALTTRMPLQRDEQDLGR